MVINQVNESENPVLQKDFEDFADSFEQDAFYRDKAVLITGATGYIGSTLVKALLCMNRKKKLGIQVIALSRNEEKAQAVFGELLKRKELEIVVCDLLTEPLNLKKQADIIIHTASITASAFMLSNPVETIDTSVEGTRKILAFARETGTESIVYLSSMEVYGNMGEKQMADEEDLGEIRLLEARSSYPESKRLCECLCAAYASEYGINVKIARLAQTFGAGVSKNENRVFAQFARSVTAQQNIILHTDGSSEGNYIYIFDALRALLLLAEKGKKGEAYNVSGDQNHLTIKEMAELAAQDISRGTIDIIYDIPKENRYGYAKSVRLKLSNNKLCALGWQPTKSVKEMYEDLISYLRYEK